jgi:4-hydroxybenzoate polyprenyltransferase
LKVIRALINSNICISLAERFLFVFAITILFDIRDLEADKHAGLKTLAKLGENKAMNLSYLLLMASFLISFFHYQNLNDEFIIWALAISTAITFLFLRLKKIRNLHWYYYGILDGTMLLQGVLVYMFFISNTR